MKLIQAVDFSSLLANDRKWDYQSVRSFFDGELDKTKRFMSPGRISQEAGKMKIIDAILPMKAGNREDIPEKNDAKLVLIPKTLEDLEWLAQAVSLGDSVLLIGETSAGKTALVRFLASLTNNRLKRFNLNAQTDKMEFIGGYKPMAGNIDRHAAIDIVESILNDKKPVMVRSLTQAVVKVTQNLTNENEAMRVVQDALSNKDWERITEIVNAMYIGEGNNERFSWNDGLLLKAIKEGCWLVLDELNLAEPDVIEGYVIYWMMMDIWWLVNTRVRSGLNIRCTRR
jgi:midasin (ATPase involved in ribosome maturation)